MNNKIFRVNGEGAALLSKTLELAFMQEGYTKRTCRGWKQTKENGLILYWDEKGDSDDIIPMCGGMNAEECAVIAMKWLKEDFAKLVTPSDECSDIDHDGDYVDGWEVYVERWGKVDGSSYAIVGIKPAYLWYGK